jgi:hypothetical protein
MRRPALALILLLGLAACAKTSTPDAGLASGVRGTVTVGPQCPVVRAGSPCPDTPFGGKVRVLRAGNDVVAEVQVDVAGAYRIPLEPGTYVLIPVVPGDGALPAAAPQTVVVRAGAFTQADLSVDTGIR